MHTCSRWLEKRGYRVTDAVVASLFDGFLSTWARDAPPPRSLGAAFQAWLQKQHRKGSLRGRVADCGGGSLAAEIEQVMADAGERGAP